MLSNLVAAQTKPIHNGETGKRLQNIKLPKFLSKVALIYNVNL